MKLSMLQEEDVELEVQVSGILVPYPATGTNTAAVPEH